MATGTRPIGMDDLAEKIRRRGVAASVHNHAEAEALVHGIAAKYKAGRHGPQRKTTGTAVL
jgi:hypothetical protein